ncbi:hypothetical protein AABB24_008884 [Solanum stoloniferum]|uniref:YABBY N-terminal domain-containing protein n=1 Tax=Solanum stoloniferum TaxID=62892 RepID=A0ABD2UGV0_9SOLN
MDYVQTSEHLCYVRCNFCNTVLAVGIPYKRLMDTVTVKCGHCSNLSFLSTRPPIQGQCFDHQPNLQGYCSEFINKGQASSSASSTSSEPLSPKAPFVVKRRRYNVSKLKIQRYHIEKLSVQLLKIGLGTFLIHQMDPCLEIPTMFRC